MKRKTSPKTKLLKAQMVFSAMVLSIGLFLLTAGFYMPPLGEIHNSVLVAFGEALTFVGSVVGVDYHYRFRYGRHDEDNEDEQINAKATDEDNNEN